MHLPNPNLFSQNPLDRATLRRRDPDWLAAQRLRPDVRFLPFEKGKPRLDPSGGLGWMTGAAMASVPDPREVLLLGLWDGVPCFAADVTTDPDPFLKEGAFTGLREAAFTLSRDEAAIAGLAAWLLNWHRQHRFCTRDGGETIISDGGFKRINPATGTEHFPRTDPVAIMLPVHGDHACLGRSPRFPPGMMSAMAGYVEACETLEECAARELHEEVGLRATRIDYVFSQPWPFPSSLMVGFLVTVTDRVLTLDPEEICDARWFSRDECRALLDGPLTDGTFAPPPFAIAHQLLKVWVNR